METEMTASKARNMVQVVASQAQSPVFKPQYLPPKKEKRKRNDYLMSLL
jgi:hypothetical protein